MKPLRPLLKFATICLLFTSCSKTPEDKAKEGIKEHLSKSMHDFDSYEPIEFGKVDTVETFYLTSPEYKKLDIQRQLMTDRYEHFIRMGEIVVGTDTKKARMYLDSAKKYNGILVDLAADIKQLSTDFKPSFAGYGIDHRYRGKNKMGALVLNDTRFLLDSTYKVIRTADKEN